MVSQIRLAVFTILVALALAAEAMAQRLPVELGVFGGLNRNTVTGVGPASARVAGRVGAFVSMPVAPVLAIRPELSLSWKEVGFETGYQPCCPVCDCLVVPTIETNSVTWLEVPLLLEARLPRPLAHGVVPRIHAGPFMALRLGGVSCTRQVAAGFPEPLWMLTDCEAEFRDGGTQVHNGDAGFILGGGVRVGSVGLGLRWTRSLVAVAPFQPLSYSRLVGAKNSTIAVTLEVATRLR